MRSPLRVFEVPLVVPTQIVLQAVRALTQLWEPLPVIVRPELEVRLPQLQADRGAVRVEVRLVLLPEPEPRLREGVDCDPAGQGHPVDTLVDVPLRPGA